MYRHKPRSHLPSPAPLAAGHGPKRRPRPRHALASLPGHLSEQRACSSVGRHPQKHPLPSPLQKHTRGDEFHSPTPCERHGADPALNPALRCQNLSAALLDARSLFLSSCSCLSQERETGPQGLAVAQTCPASSTPGPATASHAAKAHLSELATGLGRCRVTPRVPVTPSHSQGPCVKDTHPTRHLGGTVKTMASAPLLLGHRGSHLCVADQVCQNSVQIYLGPKFWATELLGRKHEARDSSIAVAHGAGICSLSYRGHSLHPT